MPNFRQLARAASPRLFQNDNTGFVKTYDGNGKLLYSKGRLPVTKKSKFKLPPQEQPKCVWIRDKDEWLVGVPEDSELLTTGRIVTITAKAGVLKEVILGAKADFPNKVIENIAYKAFHFIRI